MPQLRLEIPVALRPELKRDYECSTIPVDQLAARAGMSGRTFTARIRELGWLPRRVDLRGHRLPMLPPDDTVPVAETPDHLEPAVSSPDRADSPRRRVSSGAPSNRSLRRSSGSAA